MYNSYLGVCLVSICITLCICIAARLISQSIFDEIEKYRKRRAERKMESFNKLSKVCIELLVKGFTEADKVSKSRSDLTDRERFDVAMQNCFDELNKDGKADKIEKEIDDNLTDLMS